MAWIEILPRYAAHFRSSEWESAAAFLDWPGILVNRHRHRQVEWVESEGASFFLKKECAVTWRDRCRNAWQGFGWCATAVREAKLLQALRAAGVGCPDVAAFGEDGRQAFVLLRDEADMTELRSILPTLSSVEERRCLAESLGRELAHMHDAGFEHPDLLAKHILVRSGSANRPLTGLGSPGMFRFCFLDWQRGRQRGVVPWRVRCRDLAVLDATLHDALASDRLRLRCLQAYRRALSTAPPLGRLARHIRRAAVGLQRKRNIREVCQLPAPAKQQQLVPICDGRLLVVRSYYEELGGVIPDELMQSVRHDSSARWELAPLAHTLFRLHRFGVPAPRLLAASRGSLLTTHDTSLSLNEVLVQTSAPTRARLLRRAGVIVRQIHDAGYRLRTGEAWGHALGVIAGTEQVTLANVELLDESPAGLRNEPDRRWMRSLMQGRERQVVS